MPPSLLHTLALRLPIVQGPMAGSHTPALAAAVSAAGGLGMVGAGMCSPATIAEAAAEVRRRTDQPFGINLFVQDTPTPDAATVAHALERLAPLYAELGLPPPEMPARWCEDFRAQFEALLAARPAVASFTFGILDSADVARLHAAGCYVIGTATTVAEALAWAHVGADAVCASGMEAGGHRGSFLVSAAPTARRWPAPRPPTRAPRAFFPGGRPGPSSTAWWSSCKRLKTACPPIPCKTH